MQQVSSYSIGSTGEVTRVKILNEGKYPNDVFGCAHYATEALSAGDGVSIVSQSDAAVQHTLSSIIFKKCTYRKQGHWLVFTPARRGFL